MEMLLYIWSLMAFLVLTALAILWGIARVGKGLDRSKN